MSASLPFVSVITPVYNGAKYLAECIESVLSQTHRNYEYVIVDNCSTDGSAEIAASYAARDPRVRVVTNQRHVDLVENHNVAFRVISPESKYCKLVSADDWLYPQCIERLVAVAEANDSVGIVSAYSIHGSVIKDPRLPLGATVFDGRRVCRNFLLGSIDVFGSPTTVLYRASLVRAHDPFFPSSSLSADMAACLVCLESCDLGFVPQILSFERDHPEAASAAKMHLDGFLLDRLELVRLYGGAYLSAGELSECTREWLSRHYKTLAEAIFQSKPRGYWAYHRRRLDAIGYRLLGVELAKAASLKVLDHAGNPKATLEKVLQRVMPGQPQTRRPWS